MPGGEAAGGNHFYRRLNMSTTIYAGSSYDTPLDATREAVYDFATAMGNESVEDSVVFVRENLDSLAEELADLVRRGEWYIPNVDDAYELEVASGLLEDFLEEFG